MLGLRLKALLSCYAQNISRDFSLSTKAQNDKQRDFFAWATPKSPAELLRLE
ncbi:hypothetical protein [Campylobacter troglodytis]|uniref:hypothetical protein n=1 Tax=Campylobacter troglodytis TaxID=654363 RepID=UPI00163CC999|nr:hypothetical protein [Campylobacter troglodytis]